MCAPFPFCQNVKIKKFPMPLVTKSCYRAGSQVEVLRQIMVCVCQEELSFLW